jgi:hypothetical protein
MAQKYFQAAVDERVRFPGSEVEGERPKERPKAGSKARCAAYHDSLERAAGADLASPARARTLCFQCYRAELDRQRALGAAGALDTASEQRFQFQLPLEAINKPRLDLLKVERSLARVIPATARSSLGQYVDKRRHAQIAARHALQAIATGVSACPLAVADRDRILASAIHAAELQLPEAWLPFVVAR